MRSSGRASACARRRRVLLTSIDRDGARTGYDLALTRAVADAVADSLHAALEGRFAIEARLAAHVRACTPTAPRPDLPPPAVRR